MIDRLCVRRCPSISSIGTKPCGCVVAFVADDPAYAKDTAECVAEFIRDGYTISRVPVDEVRAKICRCKCTQEA